ncbi:MAG: hypothetical protein OIF38_11070 [Cellvibrionaceae bacterium]|nr:hypothetical protein [Cellvibrionaceae bacterium]
MDYHKQLQKFNISQADIERLCKTFNERAASLGESRQAEVLYESAAIDLALGAIELEQETQQAMKEGLSAKQWLTLLTGVKL